ncbi:MAG: hypothetical protein HYX52_04840 [Chloroflexi bacterium]|nr:hypothetical protein [Chloroflexota bacterium]
MCTYINQEAPIAGSGKGPQGWFQVTRASIGFDHPVHAPYGHAMLLDFSNPALGPAARVAVEMNVTSARALVQTLQATIDAAEASGVAE